MGAVSSTLARVHLRSRFPFCTLTPLPPPRAAAAAARVAVGTLLADASTGRPAGLTATVWNADRIKVVRPSLGAPGAPAPPADAPIVVVGAGVAGLSVAYELAVKHGLASRVVVLEGRAVGSGMR